jgi:chorismate--pyruvate lyase
MSEPSARNWRPRGVPVTSPPAALRPWLDEPGSLTRRLRRLTGEQFNVCPMNECWSRGWPDERQRLRSPGTRQLWLREVLLCRGEQPLVYARSLIPATTLRGPLRRLQRLGKQPLGALLFGRYPLVRGPIEIAPLTSNSRLARQANCQGEDPRWARRSVFSVAGRSLLVTEVFFQALVEELNDVIHRR